MTRPALPALIFAAWAVLCSSEPPLSAQSPKDCAEAFARLCTAYRHALPMEAEFRHVLRAQALNQTEVEEGTVTLAPGGKMRWAYTRPEGKLAVADGKESYLYLPGSREVFIQPISQEGPLLFRLLSGQVNLEEEMGCEGVSFHGEEAVLSLKLLKSSAEVRRVEVTTEAATGQVRRVSYLDPLGNEVSLTLSHIRTPAALSPGLFAFKVPPGVKVIRAE